MKHQCYGEKEEEIDYIFNLIINRDEKISKEFYKIINELEFNYTSSMIETMTAEHVEMIKIIIYVLYNLYMQKYETILKRIKRDELFTIHVRIIKRIILFSTIKKRLLINILILHKKEKFSMIENYFFQINHIISKIIFKIFIICLLISVILLVSSLSGIILGSLIRSQSLRSKSFKIAVYSLFFLALILVTPLILLKFKEIL